MPTYVARVWEGFDPTKEMSLPNAPGDGRPLISMDGDVNFICASCGFTLIENIGLLGPLWTSRALPPWNASVASKHPYKHWPDMLSFWPSRPCSGL